MIGKGTDMNRFISLAIAAFLGLAALAILSFSAVAGLAIAGGVMAASSIRRLFVRQPAAAKATGQREFRIWNDGRGPIIDMEPSVSR